ncbi:hypothetical protein [Tabrizicola sp.]|uniref:hypothetical protein n=1 Tax=Tabrizicola sp. TaxID=2005166 RepID=UPI003F3C1C5C
MITALRRIAIAVTLAVTPLAANAESPPELARYSSNPGSLPPEYRWDTFVTIYLDGQVLIKHCRGYEIEGPACKLTNTKTTPEAVEAILAAAKASDLAARPARELDTPPPGSSSIGGDVLIDGQMILLPPFVIDADVERVALVLRAIEAAVPSTDARLLTGE